MVEPAFLAAAAEEAGTAERQTVLPLVLFRLARTAVPAVRR
jgi:hypothetical protein